MTVYSITTDTGSLYRLDTEKQTLERSPGTEGVEMVFDNQPLRYEQLMSELTVDTPLMVMWKLKDQWKVRTTSPMVEIVRMDVSPSPD